jgi:leader peptidase (prepilin peptidase)/N-methyltransferase
MWRQRTPGEPPFSRGLWFGHDGDGDGHGDDGHGDGGAVRAVGARPGDTWGEEKRLGVPLIPDRAATRSQLAGRLGSHSGASSMQRRTVVAGALLSIVALAIAVAIGSVPLGSAAAVAMLVPAAAIDIEYRRLPDVWVGASLAVLVTAFVVGWAVGHPLDVGQSIGGALAMTLPVLVLHLVSPASMGFGDVKAAAALGAAVGTIDWRLGAVALCIATLSGAVAGLATQRRSIAFGPFLVFGAWFALLANDPIITGIFAGTTSGGLAP